MRKPEMSVVSTPRSIEMLATGTVTVGSIPKQFTASRQKTTDMAVRASIFWCGNRPSERSFATLEMSSTKPSRPVSSVAPKTSRRRALGMPTRKMEAVIMSKITMPPIVGVPCFTRWPCGPSARTCWPIWRTFSRRIHSGITTMVSAMEMMNAKNIW